MWFAQQLEPDGSAFNTADYLEIRGPVDTDRLVAAIQAAVAEIDALHVRFTTRDGIPVQEPVPPRPWPVSVVDLSAEADPELAARAWMTADLGRVIDPAVGPLGTVGLLRLGPDHLYWYQRAHHIVIDAYGASLLVARVAEHYGAARGGPAAPASTFGSITDLIAEEQEYAASAEHEADRRYWSGRLAGRGAPVSLSGRTGRSAQTARRRVVDIDPAVARRLRRRARAAGVAWPTFLIAAQAAYVHRFTGQDEITLGLPVSARKTALARTTPAMLANFVPIPLTITARTTVDQLVAAASAEAKGALRHQRYRVEQIRRDRRNAVPGAAVAGTLINHMPPVPPLRLGGGTVTVHNLSNGPVDDLAVVAYDLGDAGGMRLNLNANPDLYQEAELARHAERFRRFLDTFAGADGADPVTALPIVTAADLRAVRAWGTGPVRPVPATTLAGLFEAQARATPGAPALSAAQVTSTYAELDADTNRLARDLVARGARAGEIVALALPPGADGVRAMLAVAKTGAAYLPVDPEYPAERIALLLADAAPVVVVTDMQASGRLPEGVRTPVVLDAPDTAARIDARPAGPLTDAERVAPGPADPVYVIYTSGSTGTPKGVVVEHRSVVNYLLGCRTA
jgi:enterobactin synthetase component F